MNLESLRIARETAERMMNDPHAWTGNFNLSREAARRISLQGQRTIDVCNAYDNLRKQKKELKVYTQEFTLTHDS